MSKRLKRRAAIKTQIRLVATRMRVAELPDGKLLPPPTCSNHLFSVWSNAFFFFFFLSVMGISLHLQQQSHYVATASVRAAGKLSWFHRNNFFVVFFTSSCVFFAPQLCPLAINGEKKIMSIPKEPCIFIYWVFFFFCYLQPTV